MLLKVPIPFNLNYQCPFENYPWQVLIVIFPIPQLRKWHEEKKKNKIKSAGRIEVHHLRSPQSKSIGAMGCRCPLSGSQYLGSRFWGRPFIFLWLCLFTNAAASRMVSNNIYHHITKEEIFQGLCVLWQVCGFHLLCLEHLSKGPHGPNLIKLLARSQWW